MYWNPETKKRASYFDITKEYPNTSIPTTGDLPSLGYYILKTAEAPEYDKDLGQIQLKAEPELINGIWTDVFEFVAFTEEELIYKANAWRNGASCTALQGLLAIDQAGLSAAYESWANDANRTFAEKAFINKAQTWRRMDATLIAAAVALTISDEQLDNLFRLAQTL